MNEITYTKVGEYLLPDVRLSDPPDAPPLGKYGMMHKKYLREEKPGLSALDASTFSFSFSASRCTFTQRAAVMFSICIWITPRSKMTRPMLRKSGGALRQFLNRKGRNGCRKNSRSVFRKNRGVWVYKGRQVHSFFAIGIHTSNLALFRSGVR